MAIDDNTTYGLTGAQIKQLPDLVSGRAKVLTTADYNWPTNNPTFVRLDKLEDGLYRIDDTTTRYSWNNAAYSKTGKTIILKSAYSALLSYYANASSSSAWNWQVWGDNSYDSGTRVLTSKNVINDLTTTGTNLPLSANQGKALADRIGDLSTLTTTDKTSAVAAINEIAAGGGGSSYVAGDGISIDEESGAEVISATNTGEAKILTAADYNYPTTGTPTSIAPWLLDGGLYANPSKLMVRTSSGADNGTLALFVTNIGTTSKQVVYIQQADIYLATFTDTGTSLGFRRYLRESDIIDNLTSTSTTSALSAAQGKVLNEKIPTITMTTTDPGEGSALAANNFVAVYGTDGDAGYALAETNTGTTWVDGSTIYKKTINFGALPNATTKNVNNGITNLSRIINYEAYAYRSSTPTTIPLPFIDTTNLSRGVNITFGASTIAVTTSVDRSDFDECYITLYYTKSS